MSDLGKKCEDCHGTGRPAKLLDNGKYEYEQKRCQPCKGRGWNLFPKASSAKDYLVCQLCGKDIFGLEDDVHGKCLWEYTKQRDRLE